LGDARRGAAGDVEKRLNRDDSKHTGVGAESLVFRFAGLPVHVGVSGIEGRDVLHGTLATGEEVALHESMQPKGATPNPAHRIEHTEFICVREGALEFVHDGRTERAEAGDVIYVAKGTMHGVRNAGDGPAAYFVLAIGGDTNR
jgi:mannose-6-phosphate isomerase-like protein (cupin superfamily)